VRAEMKSFSERNPLAVGGIAIALIVGGTTLGFQYDKLPFLTGTRHYTAYFANASGLNSGADVLVSGYPVGKVSSIDLDGTRVLIKFGVEKGVHLGERTEAAIKTKTLLGSKVLEVRPRGEGQLAQTIPLDRTTSPYQLPDALGDLSKTVSNLNTDQLSQSLATLADTFSDTPPDLQRAVQGVTRFSQTLDARDQQLRNMLAQAQKATAVLAHRSDQVVSLVDDSNALLASLQNQSAALDQISYNLSAVARQLKGFIADNRQQLHPMLDKLNGVLTIIDNRKERVLHAVRLATEYGMSLGESVSSGPFFKAYVGNLLPGQFVQPFVDAAFSDLGLDPNTLPPSALSDPQTGQPGTPPLPVPFPRTGQGGNPNLNLPDAITGKSDDPRYPYREPLPAPPPGGPPPGPPAPPAADQQTQTPSIPNPVKVPAPGEPVPAGGPTGQGGQ
jgi:phospholipid/cholesterol/gamma-HCH transport system substrate-binding protein